MQEKAYKLLALQEKISNNRAKELIDQGCVFVSDKKVLLARGMLDTKTKFNIIFPRKSHILFEDENLIAVNKSFATISEGLEKQFNAKLLNRLDKGTSGVLLLCKNEEFRLKCIEEFKKQRVYKSYLAIVSGILAEEVEVNEPILTLKNKHGAVSKISKNGLSANTLITPLMVQGKKTLVKAVINTGRTHQIRLHCAHIKHGIIGDDKYAKIASNRMFLHSYETQIFNYSFKASLDESFNQFGFDIKNLIF
ncbi:RluA family pseudouridine synthase [Campylobacter sp. US33a]|uniref:RNA pseudouridylate synthase n=1 Tax=Campylobacter sp. CCS1377 TaxID=3158229 RepID=A0AAU7E5C9_9BACT|nr:RluA family pseudouridine synthase [Campylobacter sp. US33a]MCW1361138.1 RluA family pseudouridine synthase [Campylobacter jejuni]TEY01549.1 RluA family pseudouridine synthase [Campylobacter sp. US33a]